MLALAVSPKCNSPTCVCPCLSRILTWLETSSSLCCSEMSFIRGFSMPLKKLSCCVPWSKSFVLFCSCALVVYSLPLLCAIFFCCRTSVEWKYLSFGSSTLTDTNWYCFACRPKWPHPETGVKDNCTESPQGLYMSSWRVKQCETKKTDVGRRKYKDACLLGFLPLSHQKKKGWPCMMAPKSITYSSCASQHSSNAFLYCETGSLVESTFLACVCSFC